MAGHHTPPLGDSTLAVAQGRWLIENRHHMDTGECAWLLALAHFDTTAGWAQDGCRSAVDWLRYKTKLARSTCYEKVQLAAALDDRARLAAAYQGGRISYSALRLIARLEDPDPEVEESLIDLAAHSPVRHLEHAVTHYQRLADQERAPADPDRHRSIRVRPDIDGWAKVEIVLPMIEAQELAATLDAFSAVARRHHDGGRSTSGEGERSTAADDHDDGDPFPPAAPESDLSTRADDERRGDVDSDGGGGPAAADPSTWADDHDHLGQDDDGSDDGDPGRASAAAADPEEDPDPSTRADDHGADTDRSDPSCAARRWRATRALAFADLVRCALAHADGGQAAGDDRYLVHLVATDGRLALLDGTPVPPGTATSIACDASTVTHTIDEHGEPLRLGRRTRTWSTAQRRAVTVRDGGTCRFPGCDHRARDLHHLQPWEHGGCTDTTNAMAICRHHHTLLHHGGFTATPDRAGGITFHRPDGTPLDTTYHAHRPLDLDHEEVA